MLDTPREIMNKVNGETRIVNGYFDMDKKEFVTREELLKRFDSPHDYYTKSHALDEATGEHQVLWAYSKKHFMVWDAEYESRKCSFGI